MRFFFLSLSFHSKLIDASLQVAGLGAEPIGVAGTLLRAQLRALGTASAGSFLLPEGDRRLTSAHPGVGGIHFKVIVSLPLSNRAAGLASYCRFGHSSSSWLARGNLCSSFTLVHPHPAEKSTREKSPRPAPAVSLPPPPPQSDSTGDLLEDAESQTFFEVCEARSLLASFFAA